MSEHPTLSVSIPCNDHAADRVRSFVTLTLLTWSAATFLDLCLVLVSDVVNDTLERTPCDHIDLRMDRADGVIRVSVSDDGPGVETWESGADSERLRELLSERHALRWGVEKFRTGSSVWFEIEA